MWEDWLEIQYRGPTWKTVYDQFYLPAATRVNMVLKPKQWMRNRNAAVAKLHSEFFPGVSDNRLTVARSAMHSKFPECTDCQKLRTEYKTLASSSKASAAQVEKAYADLVAHAAQWQQDRETAIDLRHRYSLLSSNWRSLSTTNAVPFGSSCLSAAQVETQRRTQRTSTSLPSMRMWYYW